MNVNKININQSEQTHYIASDIYDVSYHNSGTSFESLSALLSSENLSTLIPSEIRCGGMTIRFIQSSDNKYVQYRLMSNVWSTTVADWQGVDDEPTVGSDNLVKSGGVADAIKVNAQAIAEEKAAISELIKHLYNSDYCLTVCINKFFEATKKTAVQLDNLGNKNIRGKIKVVIVSDTDIMLTIGYNTIESSDNKYPFIKTDYTHRGEISLDLGEETLNKFVIGNYIKDVYLKDATVSVWIVQDKTNSMFGLYKRVHEVEIENTNNISKNTTAISELVKQLYNSDYCLTACINELFEGTHNNAISLTNLSSKGITITGKIKIVIVSDNDTTLINSYTTVESETKYIQINIDDNNRWEYSLDLGEETLDNFVIGNYLDVPNRKAATISAWIVQDKTVSMFRLYNKTKEEYNNKFKQYENKPYGTTLENKELTDGKSALLPENYIHQSLVTSAHISFSDPNINILFGRGFNSPRGEWVEITATNINEHHYWYNEGDTVIEHTHGLTIKSPIFIEIRQGSFVDSSNYGKRIITLTNGDGNTYTITSGRPACGTPFITNKSGFNITIQKMAFTASRYTEDLWIYGDSWCEGYWLPMMYNRGYYHFLTSCRSGQASSEALRSFKNDIDIRIPKYVLWTEGMNNSSDSTETEPNDVWLSDTIEFLEICNKNNITPILQTIPSCYGNDTWQKDHRAKNAWIRDSKNVSKYQYRIAEIDMLVSNGDGTWKEGFRDSETGVHTSSLGSAICAAYYTVAVPEITKIC